MTQRKGEKNHAEKREGLPAAIPATELTGEEGKTWRGAVVGKLQTHG